jgi:hypothetical protein
MVAGWLLLIMLPLSTAGVAVCSLLANLGLAVISTVAKALVVERCDGRGQNYVSFLQGLYYH